MIFAALLIAAADPRAVVVLDGELAASCVKSEDRIVVRRQNTDSDAELNRQRQWIAEARAALVKGHSLSLELQSEAARAKIEEALSLLGRGAPALETYGEYVRALIELGAVFSYAHRDDEAANAFRRALVLETNIEPDPRQFPPDVRKRFQRVQAELLRQTRASVAITGKPEGASLFWDGRPVGSLPISISDVLPGDHWLTALSPAYHRFSIQVTVRLRNERIEVFMRAFDHGNSNERVALAVAQHSGPATAEEEQALQALAQQAPSVVIVARDRSEHADACAALYRVRQASGAVTPLSAFDRPAPFSIAALLDHPFVVANTSEHSARTPVALAMLPLGVGQFVEHRPVAGSLFLSGDLALLGANIGCYYVGQHQRQANGTYDDAKAAAALQVASDVFVFAFVATIVGGVIEGIVDR